MKELQDVKNFGGIDADNDAILLQAFEDHEAYRDVIALDKYLIIGKKGSGKTAIFKKIITTRTYDFFSYGHTFSDYPWHHHDRQARVGIPDADKYTHSWKYLILMSAAKIALNQDQSLPFDDKSMEENARLESFIVDTYGSRDPDITQIFTPTKILKIKPHFEVDLKLLKVGISPESVPVTELPTIVQEVNAVFSKTLLDCLNPDHSYFIAFDQLDLGFDGNSREYLDRLIGLLLASRDINLAAREAGIKLFIVVFLRDDIYDALHFEDKNKITENFVSLIEWDTVRTKKTLKSLMEKRFTIVLGENDQEQVKWADVVNEDTDMPGHQKKYEHMLDRTYLRPRDIIKFANSALEKYKDRVSAVHTASDSHPHKIDNIDIHNARPIYSDYFLREVDDEVHKHIPEYEELLDVLRAIGKWQFDRSEFNKFFNEQYPQAAYEPGTGLEKLFNFSFIGYYKAGGRVGGSEYIFKYRESRVRFDTTSPRFRIHPGLIEVLGLKRKSAKADE